MNKYLITYLVGDFDGRGVDRIRVGMVIAQCSGNLPIAVNRASLGFPLGDTFIMPGALLSVKPCVNGNVQVDLG